MKGCQRQTRANQTAKCITGSRTLGSIRITFIDRVPRTEPIKVRSPLIANGVPVDELAGAGVVVAMRQAQKPRFGVRIVAELPPEACWVVLADNRPRGTLVGLAQGSYPSNVERS